MYIHIYIYYTYPYIYFFFTCINETNAHFHTHECGFWPGLEEFEQLDPKTKYMLLQRAQEARAIGRPTANLGTRPGKETKNDGKSQFLMGKSTN